MWLPPLEASYNIVGRKIFLKMMKNQKSCIMHMHHEDQLLPSQDLSHCFSSVHAKLKGSDSPKLLKSNFRAKYMKKIRQISKSHES